MEVTAFSPPCPFLLIIPSPRKVGFGGVSPVGGSEGGRAVIHVWAPSGTSNTLYQVWATIVVLESRPEKWERQWQRTSCGLFYFPVPSRLCPVCHVKPRQTWVTVWWHPALRSRLLSRRRRAVLCMRLLCLARPMWCKSCWLQVRGRQCSCLHSMPGWGSLPPRISRGGFLPAAFEPNVYISSGWLQMYELFLNSWIKWLWMKMLVVPLGSIWCPGVWPSLENPHSPGPPGVPF